ncbi:hypothetical protein [Oceanobacillus sp. CAU 1775]
MNSQLKAIKEQVEKNKADQLNDSASTGIGLYDNDVILALIEYTEQLEKQNYNYREAIIEAMDLGLYGDSDDGVNTMYKILNEAMREIN